MENEKSLQLEHGAYTRIVNVVLDDLVKIPLLGAELSICLFVIRKTWGYSKNEDEISLTQFEKGINRSRPTIVKALKKLQLVNILQLVKAGSSKSNSSKWKFNKYYKTWQLVKTPQLVKKMNSTSKEKLSQLVKTPLHTKDNTKEKQKKGDKNIPTPSQTARSFFKGVKDLMEKNQSKEQAETIAFLVRLTEKYPNAEKKVIWDEIKKFYMYWTELNASGTKERWQKENAFQVDRRIVTWFGKLNGFKEGSKTNYQSKGRGLVE